MLYMELMALETCLSGATLSSTIAQMEVAIHTQATKLTACHILTGPGETVTMLTVNVRSEATGLLSPVQWSSGEVIRQTESGGE